MRVHQSAWIRPSRRTIAGTIILTQFTLDVMNAVPLWAAEHGPVQGQLLSEVRPASSFDLTLMFCDEYGNSSTRRLLGVDIVDDGTIYSSNDMFAEQPCRTWPRISLRWRRSTTRH